VSGAASATAALAKESSGVVEAQARRRGGRVVAPRRARRGVDPGAAAAIGIIGAIGTMMAIDAANRAQAAAIEDCRRRYRSYDPYSQTFVGRDGRRYRCP
jgi:hypothetical protein